MEYLSKILTDYYLRKKYISEDKQEIYQYGFKLITADIINFGLIFLTGAVIEMFTESIVFLITLCSVRQFSGGFHANSFWLCRLSMIITFISVMIFSKLLFVSCLNDQALFFMNFTCVIFISIFAPIKHRNKKLTKEQKKGNKVMAIILSVIFSLISCILIIRKNFFGIIILTTLEAIVILMIISLAIQKGGE